MIIGITGGVGCGKSTLLSLLEKEYGARLLIADEIGHSAMRQGTGPYEEIRRCFGEGVILPDGEVDRAALASVIYDSDEKRQKLNAIIHPYVYEEIRKKLREWRDEPLIALETAILFETGCDGLCDQVWGVVADREERIRRLMESRGYSREKSEAIMSKQLADDEWKRRCDHIIDNSREQKKLLAGVQELLGR